MNQKLSVEIGADVSELERALLQTKKSIQRVEGDIRKTTITLSKYSKAQEELSRELKEGNISQKQFDSSLKILTRNEERSKDAVQGLKTELSTLRGNYKDLGGSTRSTTQAVDKFGKTTSTNAVPAMTSFSQVIQDAPYGIRGVANNITQLTSQMGYLAKSSGGVMGALKALGSTLIGPAGILLAVSVVTSLMVSYGDKLFGAKDATKELEEATSDLIGTAKSEITVLKTLLKVAKDENQSKENRQRAINKINDLYSEYLPNLSLETINTNEVSKAVDNLTNSLIRQAKIRGIQNVISEKYGEIAKKTAEVVKEANEDLKEGLKFGGEEDPRTLPKNMDKINEKVNEVRNNLKKGIIDEKVNEEVGELNSDVQSLMGQLEELIQQDIEVGGIYTNADKVDTPSGKPEIEVEAKVSSEDPFGGDYAMEGTLNGTFGSENDINGFQQFLRDREVVFDEHLERMDMKTEDFAERQRLYGQIMAQGFLAFGDAIGEALDGSDDAFADFVRSFLKSASKMILGLIAQSLGNAILGATQTATATGPAAAITLPGFMAASIGVVQGAVGGIPSFNDGGMVGGGMPTGDKILARLNSGEMVLNQSQQSSLFRLLDSGVRAGGSQPLEIVGESRISGDTIITAYRRAETMNKRIS